MPNQSEKRETVSREARMNISDEEMDSRFGPVIPPASLDDIYDELNSIKCAVESIENMIRGVGGTIAAIVILGVIIFFAGKLF